jgi:rhamnulokinase
MIGLLQDRALVAIDLGAESCRVSLLRWKNKVPEISLVHRFPNAPMQEDGGLRWNIRHIVAGLEEGLHKCAEIVSEEIAAVAVDGWAVDYVRLDENGEPLANPFCYRDERTVESQRQVHARISAARLYHLTGAQILPLNTLYQLRADRNEQNIPWLNLPEYVLMHLGGKRVSEFTNATHTQLLSIHDQTWSGEIFSAAGLDIHAAPPVVVTGTVVGQLKGTFAKHPAFRNTRLIAPACHDTASAIAGIPAHGDNWAFISSGTWSLVGCVLDSPQTSEAARSKNFSNEGGVGGKIYFLKNVNGMWILRECLDQWQSQGSPWNITDLLDACGGLPEPEYVIDVDHSDLLLPGNMPARINAQLKTLGRPIIPEQPSSAPQLASLILHSLAARYAAVLRDITEITGKTFTRLHIVGGGSRNTLLNDLTAKAAKLDVVAGPSECATIGNFSIQLAALAGKYNERVGVESTAVSEYARFLASKQIENAVGFTSLIPPRTRQTDSESQSE